MKNIIFIIIILLLTGCSSLQRKNKITWNKPIEIQDNLFKIYPGDIIIKKRGKDFLSWFGHCGIITDNYSVAEIPKLGTSFMYTPIDIWLFTCDDLIIMRLKNIDDNFRKEVMLELKKAEDKKYKILFRKNNDSGYYCSQLIWKVFKDVGKRLDKKVNLDDGGIFVLPYDLLNSENLEQIKLNNLK